MTDFELPLLQIDSVVSQTSASMTANLALINRDPSQEETDVPVGSAIAIELVSFNSKSIALATVRVFVGGVQATQISGASLVPVYPFNGGRSSVVSWSSGTTGHVRIVLDPVLGLPSLGTVEVIVEAGLTDGSETIREVYSFSIEDKTGPVVQSAQSLDQLTVRVTFTEPVEVSSLPGFVLTAKGAPAVTPGVASVSVDGSSAIVTLDTEMSPDISYEVQATGITDVAGNPVLPATSIATFSGFRPLSPRGRVFDLWSMLPKHNRADDSTGDLARLIACLQDVASLLLASVDRWVDIFDYERAPEAFVDLILQDLGNPFAFDLTLAEKRRLASVLVEIYQQKGTAIGLKNAIRFFLGIEVTVAPFVSDVLILGESLLGVNWELGPRLSWDRYAFNVVVPRMLTTEERKRVRAIVEYLKPGHTHFAELVEPTEEVDTAYHWELGLSLLGVNTTLHNVNETLVPNPVLGIGVVAGSSSVLGGGSYVTEPWATGTLVAVYEADYGVTLNGSTVASWAPKYVKTPVGAETEASLRALYTITQSATASQPTFSANRGDGLPELAFDGTDDFMTNAAVAAALPLGTYAIAATGELLGEQNDDRWIWIGDPSNPGGMNIRAYTAGSQSNGTMQHYIVNTTNAESFYVNMPVSGVRSPSVFSRNGTALSARNGDNVGSLTSSAAAEVGPSTLLTLGCRATAPTVFDKFSACKISALYVFSSAVDLSAAVAMIRTRVRDFAPDNNPANFGTLVGAYEADYGVTLNGSTVSSWAPKYGPGPALVQATAANQPTFVADRGDGRAEILFDGVNDVLLSAVALATALPSSAHAVVLTGKLSSTVAGGRLLEVNVGGNYLNQTLLIATTYSSWTVVEAGVRNAGAWGTISSTTISVASTARFALLLTRNGSSWTVAAKSVTQAATLATEVSGGNTLSVGMGSGVYFGGTISAMWIFSTPITDVAGALSAIKSRWPDFG